MCEATLIQDRPRTGRPTLLPSTVYCILVTGLAALAVGCGRRSGSDAKDTPHIYVADWMNHRLVCIDGVQGRSPMALEGRFRFPVGVCADATGRIYVSEQDPSRIVRIDDLQGTNWTVFTRPNAARKLRNKYMGSWIFVDYAARIYTTYDGDHRIICMDDLRGTNTRIFGSEGSGPGQFRYPAGIWVDAGGRIFVADFDNFRIVRIDDMQGTNWTTFGHYGSGLGEFINPCGIWGDPQGRLYIADQGNDRVVRIDDMNGANWTEIGTFGTDPEPGNLYAPCGVCVDRGGRIYVTESSSNSRVIRMDDMQGTNWTVLSSLGGGAEEFHSPMGIVVR